MSQQFPLSTFDGRVQIGCRSYEKSVILPALTCDYSKLVRCFEDFYISPMADYYITANAFAGVSRKSEELFSFHNFVIDIDCHLTTFSTGCLHLSEQLLWRLRQSLFGVEIEPPTSYVFTGRGLQLWWSIVGISVKFKRIYHEVLDYYINALISIISEDPFDDFSMFQVDLVASRNAVGYFRLPGTVNSKTKTLVSWHPMAGTYDLLELHEKIAPELLKKAEVTRDVVRPFDLKTFTNLAEERASAFERLRDVRGNSVGGEERNNFCFMIYNALVITFGHDYAYERMLRFNENFIQPLTLKELDNVISTAKKKGGYQYTTTKIIEFFNISPYECEKIGLTSGESPYLDNQKRKQILSHTKKDKRNQKILEMYDNGATMKHIASTLDLSFPTVDKVLKANNRKNKEERQKKIKVLATQGKKNKEIAELCGCSLRTVQRVLSSI